MSSVRANSANAPANWAGSGKGTGTMGKIKSWARQRPRVAVASGAVFVAVGVAVIIAFNGTSALTDESSCSDWVAASQEEKAKYVDTTLGMDPSDDPATDGVVEDAPEVAMKGFEEECGKANRTGGRKTLDQVYDSLPLFARDEIFGGGDGGAKQSAAAAKPGEPIFEERVTFAFTRAYEDAHPSERPDVIDCSDDPGTNNYFCSADSRPSGGTFEVYAVGIALSEDGQRACFIARPPNQEVLRGCFVTSLDRKGGYTPAEAPDESTQDGGARDTRASECGRPGVQRPEAIVLTCADAGLRVERLRWSRWGGPVAVARGVQTAKDCDPDCASGGLRATPATVQLTNPRRCPGSSEMYYRNATLIPQNGPRSSYELGDRGSGCPS